MARNRKTARASRVLYWAITARTQPDVSAGSTKRKYRSETRATSTPTIPQAKPVLSGPEPLLGRPYIQRRIQHHRGSLCDPKRLVKGRVPCKPSALCHGGSPTAERPLSRKYNPTSTITPPTRVRTPGLSERTSQARSAAT